jgi:tripartite-type tricarboxylate transporter receptor subunit TctC
MRHHHLYRTGALLALCAATALTPLLVQAQNYPAQPVTMIVNFPPAGVTDLVGRALATSMSQNLKQTVIVQNKGGAGGAIGATAVATAPKDGYSIGFVATAALTTLPQMREVPYQVDSLEYICRTFDVPVYLLVAPDSSFKSAGQLIAFAKANPGKLNYATVGPGSLPHLASLDFADVAGVRMTHIPYQGEGPAVTDLLGKHVDVYFGTGAVATTHNLRRLGVAAPKRQEESPDTPTLGELGYPIVWSVMGGLIAPHGISVATRQTLEKSCAEAVNTPAYKSALAQLKVGWAFSDSAEFKSLILADTARNRLVLKSADLLLK